MHPAKRDSFSIGSSSETYQEPLHFCSNFFAFWFFLLLEAGTVIAQEPARQRELLLFKEIPIVITATRRAQLLTQAPSAITVITSDEIRQSGATNIPELFRVVPGLDMFRTSASNVSLATRGLNRESPVRIQVLVDGLSIYEDLANVVFWYQIPISLEEIERIEIVRSPATALYGAKAFGGIIHIITKAPEALQGTHFSGTAGEAGTGIVNLIHAGVDGNFTYKASVGYDRTNQFPNPPVGRTRDELGRADTRGHFLVNYKLAEDSRVSLSGGLDDFDRKETLPAGPSQNVAAGWLGFVKANYEVGNLQVQLSYNRFHATASNKDFFEDVALRLNLFQAQLQHSLTVGPTNILTGGTTYRFVDAYSPFFGGNRLQHLASVFLQDEWQLRDNLALTIGVGVDVHPQAGVSASPRGSLVYSPWHAHTFRLSIGRGIRNPALIENFEAFMGKTFVALGDRDLHSEEILSFEVGYQAQLLERVRVRLDVFYNHLDHLIDFKQTTFLTTNPLLPPLPLLQYLNVEGGNIFGGEVGVEIGISSWLKGFVNYSYQEQQGNISAMGFAPHHKGNAGLTFSFPNGLSANILVHHTGKVQGVASPLAPFAQVDPYTLVNLRLGYDFKVFGYDTELAVQVFNLFNDVHREVPPDVRRGSPGGDLIERRVSGTIRARF